MGEHGRVYKATTPYSSPLANRCFFIVKIEILDDDEAYKWMQVWLAARLQDNLAISVVTKRNKTPCQDEDELPVIHGKTRPSIHFVPAVGTYFFWYKGRCVNLNRNREEKGSAASPVTVAGGDSMSMLRNKESFTLRIFSRNKSLARMLIEECRDKAIPNDDKVDILIANYGYWSVGSA